MTKASTGLSPDALQSTTATAVAATMQAQAAQIEVMARNLAEGGMRQMFKLMLKCMVENVDEEQMMRLQGQSYVPVDPRSWNLGMDVSINVGLGTGREDQKVAVLESGATNADSDIPKLRPRQRHGLAVQHKKYPFGHIGSQWCP